VCNVRKNILSVKPIAFFIKNNSCSKKQSFGFRFRAAPIKSKKLPHHLNALLSW
jgi:hypothetical protein